MPSIKRETPRQQLARLNDENGFEGFYGINYQIALCIENYLDERANKLAAKLFYGTL